MIAVSIDGALVAPEQASISVFDRGLLYGDGAFEVLRTWDGVAVELEAHLDRLAATAAFLALRLDRRAIAGAVGATLAAAGPGEHRVRIVVTRGPGALAVPLTELGPGRAIVIVEPLPPVPAAIALALVDWPIARRHGHKTLAYLDHVIARELARAAGADDAIRLDPQGRVVEGGTCNVFAVAGGRIVTPALETGALPGIVRARVLARAGIAAVEGTVTVDTLRAADEIFVTSSLRGVVPVNQLDGSPRKRGAVTEQIRADYASEMHLAALGRAP